MFRIARPLAAAVTGSTLTAALTVVVGPAGPAAAEVAPDGRIVYVSSTPTGSDVHVMNADGTGDVNLTPDPKPTDEFDPLDLDPVWSPDGTRIAFISNRVTEGNPDGNLEVFAMDADGANLTQITFANPPNTWDWWQSYDPDWSPDGTRLVFSGYRDALTGSELFVVPADGSGTEVHITNDEDQANKWEPDWSPDGTTILFTWGWDQ